MLLLNNLEKLQSTGDLALKFLQKTIKITLVLVCILTVIFGLGLPALVKAAASSITRVSVDSSGTQANNDSIHVPYISADGRYVAFESDASNLVPNDTNGVSDIFVHDITTGATTRVSVDSSGNQGNSSSFFPSFSADGRYVAFASDATNLVAGDTNGARDIFLHDRTTSATTRVSVDSTGTQGNGSSYYPSISSDGRYVVFYSTASNLVAGDSNGVHDVFVHDRTTGITTRVSVDSSGTQANGISTYPFISADGRYVAFESDASNLVAGDTNGRFDIFVHDRTTGATTRVSVDSSGMEGNNNSNDQPSISADGRYVAFSSSASNLVAGDTNGWQDIFLHDRTTGATTRVSVASDGSEGNSDSAIASISADGRYVVFVSRSTNLVAGDTNGGLDVFVYEHSTGATTRVSVAADGTEANGTSQWTHISSNGRYVAFVSSATNLVAGDTNGRQDIFMVDRLFSSTSASVAPTPTPTLRPGSLPASGFAPDRLTALREPSVAYTSIDNPTLSIPSLELEMTIVGVPRQGDGWDVSWLGDDAGYLEGSSFPTSAGNSVITAHVWNANNQPGPFINLKQLQFGDQVIINTTVHQYIYEVRENKLVNPNSIQAVMKQEQSSWLTLVTCESFNEATGTYLSRRMVKAVLVEVN